ncbi:uncharacterized protein E0L32_004471 [Thyridium curvatum]|uniref:Uncharacterized protein n=1 Tax=Thyridium curvatum TaxID=1093900 RepID=A0A507BEV5_9PEZI|nr:uncharacterized protein E0L32_004471 [Thyridium curvatum]TPX15491.1 hypothetical protein E0L32_004471 [Thyridium curvatum]
MSFLNSLLRATNFRSPLLRTLVPSVGAAFAIQAAFAVPSILAQSERFYDLSGSLTHLTVIALSLYLPALRARAAGGAPLQLPSLLEPFTNPSGAALNWRQVALSGAAAIWTIRLGSYLFQRITQQGSDSRFDEIKKSPPKFFAAWMAQATWVSLVLMPVVALNSVPAAALASAGALVGLTDALGLGLYAGGLGFEVVADRQKSRWMAEKKAKQHDEEFMTRGLWSTSQFPNYFGESTLWTGIATLAAGALASKPAQAALGFGGLGGRLGVAALAAVSPLFTTFLLLKVSGVPLSEKKYDKRYGDRKDYQQWKKNTPRLVPELEQFRALCKGHVVLGLMLKLLNADVWDFLDLSGLVYRQGVDTGFDNHEDMRTNKTVKIAPMSLLRA